MCRVPCHAMSYILSNWMMHEWCMFHNSQRKGWYMGMIWGWYGDKSSYLWNSGGFWIAFLRSLPSNGGEILRQKPQLKTVVNIPSFIGFQHVSTIISKVYPIIYRVSAIPNWCCRISQPACDSCDGSCSALQVARMVDLLPAGVISHGLYGGSKWVQNQPTGTGGVASHTVMGQTLTRMLPWKLLVKGCRFESVVVVGFDPSTICWCETNGQMAEDMVVK